MTLRQLENLAERFDKMMRSCPATRALSFVRVAAETLARIQIGHHFVAFFTRETLSAAGKRREQVVFVQSAELHRKTVQ